VRVVAIDGPVGAGKSTVARAVGERLGLPVLETGAMYRAVAACALRHGIEPGPSSAGALVELAADLPPEAVDDPDGLRTPDVNRVVSAVAAVPGVRTILVERQRAWAEAHGGGVVEGRDIGTVVFPDAEVKVFLTASPLERARRRGGDEDAATLAERDRIDSTRAVSPLVPAPDAVVIDTTSRSVKEIVEEIVSLW
jgi:cytidylate kinase